MKEHRLSEAEIDLMGKKIPHEVHLMYTLALSMDAILFDIERRMAFFGNYYRQEPKHRVKEYLGKVKDCQDYFEAFLTPTILHGCTDPRFKDYDRTRAYSQELVRLIMLYYETVTTPEKSAEVFNLMADFGHGRNVFESGDINHFSLGCKKHEQQDDNRD